MTPPTPSARPTVQELNKIYAQLRDHCAVCECCFDASSLPTRDLMVSTACPDGLVILYDWLHSMLRYGPAASAFDAGSALRAVQ